MKKEIKPEALLLSKASKIFYVNIFDAFLSLLCSVLLFFGVINPILNATGYQEEIVLKNKNAETALKIAEESKLLVYNEEKNAISTVESLYKVYIYQNIKMCYEEYSEIYKEDLDNSGYSTKKEFFETVKINSYENDFLGYFYTNYIVDKVNDDGNKVVDYALEESKEYFVNNVLDINNKGKEFFEFDGDYNNLPRLKKDTCRYLFEYHVMNISYSTLRELDRNFFNYFKDKYIEAGNVLCSYDTYRIPLETYNNLYKIVENKTLIAEITGFFSGLIICYLVLPLSLKHSRTLGQLIFKMVRYDEEKKEEKSYILPQFIVSIIRVFPINLLLIFFIGGGVNLLNFHFLEIGNFTLNILHLILLTFIIDIIWLIALFVSKPKRGFLSKMTHSNYYDVIS